jgi:Na+/H+-dicarboxylate symporter
MLIVPLVVASMVVGITGLGDVRSLGRMGGITVIYYTVTTGLAVLMGMILVNWIQPGAGLKLGTSSPPWPSSTSCRLSSFRSSSPPY